jgi:hypothetical protein
MAWYGAGKEETVGEWAECLSAAEWRQVMQFEVTGVALHSVCK